MSCERHESLRTRAIQMRKAGASYQQISEGLSISMGVLCRWIREAGLTVRNRTTSEQRTRAIELRKKGMTYSEIEIETGVPRSTLSNLLKGVPLTDEHAAFLAMKQRTATDRAGATNRARRMALEARTIEEAAAQVGRVSARELFLAGVLLYWAEGAKAKPWSRGGRVTFINSDPTMIRLFIRWLELVGIGADRLILRVAIHERADVERAVKAWSRISGVPVDLFRRPTLKHHNPKPSRRNVGQNYIGCLIITVSKSTTLYRQIVGWYEGIVAEVERMPRSVIGSTPPFEGGRGGSRPPGAARSIGAGLD